MCTRCTTYAEHQILMWYVKHLVMYMYFHNYFQELYTIQHTHIPQQLLERNEGLSKPGK